MAESIFQKRIYELETFIPLTFGEPGWEDPSTIWLGVDKLGWPEAKRMALIEFIANLHKEQGPVPISSVNVVVVYDNEFVSNNYYINIVTQRVVSVPGIGDIIENIPIVDFVKTTTGFTCTLQSYQAGDYFNFLAFE